jgi:selenide,water dikinase
VAVPLTSLSHGAGCGCKLGAEVLSSALRGVAPGHTSPDVLVGFAGSDDAGVYRLSDELALVQTVDFFTPIVDDPFDFGRIAATNALSDVYAMGGRPITALNLVAFPVETLGHDVLREILAGGAAVCEAAEVAIVGGHSIDDPEPKYGLAVSGTVHPDRVLTNAGGRAGDALVLTKPLGAGAITTALKRGLEAPLQEAVDVMTTLNRDAAAAALAAGAHALTDVTGFGLLGHLHRMLRASGMTAEVWADQVPLLPGAAELAAAGFISGGTNANMSYLSAVADIDPETDPVTAVLLHDAQTSGGLLIAVPAAGVDALRADLRAAGTEAALVGTVEQGEPGRIAVRATTLG